EDPGIRHGVLKWRAGSESLSTHRPNSVYRQALLQEVRPRAHQTAGTWRQERAHQFQKYLGTGTAVKRTPIQLPQKGFAAWLAGRRIFFGGDNCNKKAGATSYMPNYCSEMLLLADFRIDAQRGRVEDRS